MNKEIESYHKATKEQGVVEPEGKVQTRSSNFVLNQSIVKN